MTRPLMFLPSRTTTTSTSVVPSGRREGVGMARGTSPSVGVRGRHDDAVGIGPVVLEPFPDTARALRDVGVGRALVMDLEVVIGAAAKQLRAPRPEVGERGDELLRRRGGRFFEVDCGHASSFFGQAREARECCVTPADDDVLDLRHVAIGGRGRFVRRASAPGVHVRGVPVPPVMRRGDRLELAVAHGGLEQELGQLPGVPHLHPGPEVAP